MDREEEHRDVILGENVQDGSSSEGCTDPMTKTIRLEQHNTWIRDFAVPAFNAMHSKEFQVQHGDVLLASVLKSGTTWMKSVLHSIMACVHGFPNLLGDQNPHYIVPNIEMSSLDSWPHLTSPRLLSTHLPLHDLPRQIPHDDQLKIVYVTRNPRDTFVSFWKFWERLAESAVKLGIQRHIPKEVLLEKYCAGHFHGGPFSDNVLSYLRESRRRPDKVLFVTYEDLHTDCQGVICKIGNFLGYPSDVVEGNVSQIAKCCSFRNISSLDINKKDESSEGLYPPNSAFFRSGETGGWREHFTPAMIERMRQEIEQKLEDEGLYFDYT